MGHNVRECWGVEELGRLVIRRRMDEDVEEETANGPSRSLIWPVTQDHSWTWLQWTHTHTHVSYFSPTYTPPLFFRFTTKPHLVFSQIHKPFLATRVALTAVMSNTTVNAQLYLKTLVGLYLNVDAPTGACNRKGCSSFSRRDKGVDPVRSLLRTWPLGPLQNQMWSPAFRDTHTDALAACTFDCITTAGKTPTCIEAVRCKCVVILLLEERHTQAHTFHFCNGSSLLP